VHSAQVAAALTHTDKRRLVLHFDINKTILMIDTVAGKNLAQVVFIKSLHSNRCAWRSFSLSNYIVTCVFGGRFH